MYCKYWIYISFDIFLLVTFSTFTYTCYYLFFINTSLSSTAPFSLTVYSGIFFSKIWNVFFNWLFQLTFKRSTPLTVYFSCPIPPKFFLYIRLISVNIDKLIKYFSFLFQHDKNNKNLPSVFVTVHAIK